MTALTLRVIWKNPTVTLHEIFKNFPKIHEHLLHMATSTLPQNLHYQSCLSPLGQTLVCVLTGLRRSMNYNML